MNAQSNSGLTELSEADRLKLFLSGIVDYAIFMLTPEGNVCTWNAGAQRFKGYTADEIIGQHFSRFYTAEDIAKGEPERALHTALTEGKFEDEGWRVRKDGTRFWASVVIDPIYDNQGELFGFAKIMRDITERTEAQEALRESEERFRLLVEGVTDYALYMLSPTGIITNWNAGAQRIKGYTADEVVGTHFSRFYTEEDRAAGLPAQALETAAREGRFEREGWRVRKDGTRFWTNVVIDPIRNERGELVGFAKLTRDITEKRNAALALDRAKEALFQSQKLEAIGKLTGGVAHDFNNLLGVITSGLELLAREVRSPIGRRVLESMQRASMRGATLTQQLLSFARQQPLRQDKYDINRVLNSFEAVLRQASSRAIRIAMELAPGLSPVMLDITQFEAALLNLVSNARDAMPGGGTVTLRTEQVALAAEQVGTLSEGNYVKLTVEDTGSGMPPEVVARAVEPFFTTKPIGKGTGMGLSQVYGLMHQCGGELTLQSAPGRGTAVSLYFPVLQGTSADDLASVDTNAGNEKALVVDDQPDVLAMAAELFRTLGYDVLTANNGEEAIDILKRNPEVDVLFSDVVMPGMDGVELGRAARKLRPGIKVVLASGFPAPALREADKEGIHEFTFVTKPYRLAELLKSLRHSD
jgi:PAS domain S-box-containing protein